MAYSERIKNFDQIRNYMRSFFVYGFHTREEFGHKSARTYDNERRRIQSYLGELVSFRMTEAGKQLFISLDGRSVSHNPLYRAFRAKSFTDRDITLHFMVLDILSDMERHTSLEILDALDADYLSCFEQPMTLDESTLRKKLKEYVALGLVQKHKEGAVVSYSIVQSDLRLADYAAAIRFFTEEDPLGVVGSYLEDRFEQEDLFGFKNHYIMNAYDAQVLEGIFGAIRERRMLKVTHLHEHDRPAREPLSVIPLKLYISVQGGRNYLLCRSEEGQFLSLRVDYIASVETGELVAGYEEEQARFAERSRYMWGVTCQCHRDPEHITMDILVQEHEMHIVRRLRRERRCGTVRRMDADTYRFEAYVYDCYEMLPWIRTFFGRIKHIDCSNQSVLRQIKRDLQKLARQYEV